MIDLISRQAAIDAVSDRYYKYGRNAKLEELVWSIEGLPSAQPEKEILKRVRWSGWKGHRYTRYYCPNCEKPVRNDDCYCHRCGQKMMFPKISFSDYVPGEKQQTIVTWDDNNG